MATIPTELAEAAPFTSGKAGRVLAGIWRTILKDKKIDNAMIYEKISIYCDSLTQTTLKRRAQIRGNMRTDALKEDLTLYTFTKNLRALSVQSLEIEFTLKHIRRSSKHILTIPLNDDYVNKSKDGEGEESPLGPFLAEVMFNLGIDYSLFETLLELYMRRTASSISPEAKNDLRAYFRKEFRSTKMSWASLIKGFVFLCVLDVDMKITLTQAYNFKSTHNFKFSLAFIEDFSEIKDKEDVGI